MLDLRFSTFAGKIRVSSDAGSMRQLQSLRGMYASSSSVGAQSFDVELDDLLVNLRELAAWPKDDLDVRWQPELLRLVESNDGDARTVASTLEENVGVSTSTSAVDASRFRGGLTDFQLRDFEQLVRLTHGANFSVPGAGKTRVALAVFEARRLAGVLSRMLVVCPKSAFESWQTEVGICYPDGGLRIAIMDGPIPPIADVVLVNYERLPDARAALIGWLLEQRALLLLDEAHRMKLGPAGAWGSVCLALGPYAASRLILTGTPAPNGSRDLENLFGFVWPGLGRRAVSTAIAGNDLRTASGLLRPLFARTTKGELGLPAVDIAVRRIDLPPIHRELYNSLLGQFSRNWQGDEQDIERLGKIILYLLMAATTPALLAVGSSRHEPLAYRVPPLVPKPGSSLGQLMRDLPFYELSPKYKEVLAIVSENASKGRKTLVWSTFVRNLTSLAALLKEFSPAVIHGGTPDRKAELIRFRTDPHCLVLLSNPATLGEGVSLHIECHDAVYVDRDFAAGRFMQSLDRIHRLGLPPETLTRITVLVANQTIDELVESRLAMKLHFMGTILDDPAVLELSDLDEEPSVSAGMDNTDIQALAAYLRGNATA